MLTLTEAAGARLAQILDEERLPVEVVFRFVDFVKEEDGIAMRRDTARPGDATFEHEGRAVLLLDEQVSGLLAAETLVVNDSDGLTLRSNGDSV